VNLQALLARLKDVPHLQTLSSTALSDLTWDTLESVACVLGSRCGVLELAQCARERRKERV
jgi:hypothetical protein